MANLKTQCRDHTRRLLERWQGLRGDFTQAFTNLAALTALALLVSAYAVLPLLEVFGHDEVHYYPDLSFKLGEDGRWLNYFLHGFLRSLPAPTWALLLLVTSGTLLFRLARSLGFTNAQAALPAAAILLAPSFIEQSLWPATTIPAVIVLLLAQTLIARGVAEWRVYLFAGVFSFGTVQSFYFLMPLLFLGQFQAAPAAHAPPWLAFVRHMFWWVLGAVVGVLVMSFMLWSLTGHFGVQPAEWRQTQPMRDFGGLFRNIRYVIDACAVQTTQLMQQAGAGRGFWLIALALLIVRARFLCSMLPAVLILIMVAAAFFAFSVPLAPIIQPRSLVALAAAFVLALALLPGKGEEERLTGMLLLLVVSYGFSLNGHAYLSRHRDDTGFLYHKLQQALPAPPGSYAAVVLSGSMPPGTPHAFLFNDASRMHGIMAALGVRDYRDCRPGTDERCKGLDALSAQATLPLAGGQLAITVTGDNVAVLNYQEGTTAPPR